MFLFCTTGWAALLDQSQTLSNGGVAFWPDSPIVQTFTPNMTGWLETLTIPLGSSGEAATTGIIEPIHIAIAEWDGARPQTILGQVDSTLRVNIDLPPAWMDFDFLSQDVWLCSETMYALVLLSEVPQTSEPYRNVGVGVQWDGDLYDRGGLWKLSDDQWIPWPYGTEGIADATFETWMRPVPIPATIFLLGSGLIGLAGFRRKFKK